MKGEGIRGEGECVLHRTLRTACLLLSLLFCFGCCGLDRADAQLTSFSYSGKLASSINGSYDFKFTLYNAASGGNTVGSPVTITSVTVTNGIYTATGIDFGTNSFTTAPLYLTIAYRKSGSSGSWSNVSGRVLLTARLSIVAQTSQTAQNALAIGGHAVSGIVPNTGQALVWSGTAWGPGYLPTYGAGAGLSLTGSIFSIASGGVTSGMLGSGAVTAAALASGAVTSAALAANAVTTGAIADGAVTASKLSWPLSESLSSSNALLSLNNTGSGYGGSFSSGSGVGIYSSSSSNYGVYGSSSSSVGVYGTSANDFGVYGYSSNGDGVFGGGNNVGVYGSSQNGAGVYGYSGSGDGVSSYSSSGFGGRFSSGSGIGVYAQSSSNLYAGGFFTNSSSGDGMDSTSSSGIGVYGSSNNDVGVYGTGGLYAGYFSGDLGVSGTIYAGTKDFRIDHPLDPANKYLLHACLESDQMKTFYDGHVTTDANGNATVTLPDWFEALNTDFEYYLTVIGQFAQAIISREIHNHQFSIQTDKPNVKVSWQVTGVRQDAYAKAHPLQVEQEKPEQERGKYLHPVELGLDPTLGIDYGKTHPHK